MTSTGPVCGGGRMSGAGAAVVGPQIQQDHDQHAAGDVLIMVLTDLPQLCGRYRLLQATMPEMFAFSTSLAVTSPPLVMTANFRDPTSDLTGAEDSA